MSKFSKKERHLVAMAQLGVIITQIRAIDTGDMTEDNVRELTALHHRADDLLSSVSLQFSALV